MREHGSRSAYQTVKDREAQAAKHNRMLSNLNPRGVAQTTVVTAESPEGILLELRPAGLSVRLYAFAIDWVIRVLALYVVAATPIWAPASDAGEGA